jgi:hypothetical protein
VVDVVILMGGSEVLRDMLRDNGKHRSGNSSNGSTGSTWTARLPRRYPRRAVVGLPDSPNGQQLPEGGRDRAEFRAGSKHLEPDAREIELLALAKDLVDLNRPGESGDFDVPRVARSRFA